MASAELEGRTKHSPLEVSVLHAFSVCTCTWVPGGDLNLSVCSGESGNSQAQGQDRELPPGGVCLACID